jgi:hypothetical protein
MQVNIQDRRLADWYGPTAKFYLAEGKALAIQATAAGTQLPARRGSDAPMRPAEPTTLRGGSPPGSMTSLAPRCLDTFWTQSHWSAIRPRPWLMQGIG